MSTPTLAAYAFACDVPATPLTAGNMLSVNPSPVPTNVVIAAWGVPDPQASAEARVSFQHSQNPESRAVVASDDFLLNARDMLELAPLAMIQIGSVDGTVFALNFQLDYYLDRAFSFGPMVHLVPGGDLTQIAMAGVARYHFRVDSVNIVPFAGFGFVHASLERGTGPGRIDTNDTSHYIPLGVTFEYQIAKKLALANTVMLNLHDLSMDPPIGRDRTSVAVLFGFRFGP